MQIRNFDVARAGWSVARQGRASPVSTPAVGLGDCLFGASRDGESPIFRSCMSSKVGLRILMVDLPNRGIQPTPSPFLGWSPTRARRIRWGRRQSSRDHVLLHMVCHCLAGCISRCHTVNRCLILWSLCGHTCAGPTGTVGPRRAFEKTSLANLVPGSFV